jgi:hypothetical protein
VAVKCYVTVKLQARGWEEAKMIASLCTDVIAGLDSAPKSPKIITLKATNIAVNESND